MWPPMEIPGIEKVSTRLRTTKNPNCWRELLDTAASRDDEHPAIRPKIAPEAPTVTVFGSSDEGAERAGDQGDEVDAEEAGRPDAGLEDAASDVEHVHVERRWRNPAWRKPPVIIRHQSPFATSGPLRPASWITDPPPLKPRAATDQLDQEDDHVDPDQCERRRHLACRRAEGACHRAQTATRQGHLPGRRRPRRGRPARRRTGRRTAPHQHPLIAGDGTALFATAAQRRPLDLRSVTQLPAGKISLVYAVG